jgi:hypothetical protein
LSTPGSLVPVFVANFVVDFCASFVVSLFVGGSFAAFAGLLVLDQTPRESCAGLFLPLDEVLGNRLLRGPSFFCSGRRDAGLFCRSEVAQGLFSGLIS